jgi:hypothetical protein
VIYYTPEGMKFRNQFVQSFYIKTITRIYNSYGIICLHHQKVKIANRDQSHYSYLEYWIKLWANTKSFVLCRVNNRSTRTPNTPENNSITMKIGLTKVNDFLSNCFFWNIFWCRLHQQKIDRTDWVKLLTILLKVSSFTFSDKPFISFIRHIPG